MTRKQYRPRRRNTPRFGLTLIEALVSIGLLGTVAALIGSTFAYSLGSQSEARKAVVAARCAGQLIELLRARGYGQLELMELRTLDQSPLAKLDNEAAASIRERLWQNQLELYCTVRPYLKRDQSRQVWVTVVSQGLSPKPVPARLPAGQIAIHMATIISDKGITH